MHPSPLCPTWAVRAIGTPCCRLRYDLPFHPPRKGEDTLESLRSCLGRLGYGDAPSGHVTEGLWSSSRSGGGTQVFGIPPWPVGASDTPWRGRAGSAYQICHAAELLVSLLLGLGRLGDREARWGQQGIGPIVFSPWQTQLQAYGLASAFWGEGCLWGGWVCSTRDLLVLPASLWGRLGSNDTSMRGSCAVGVRRKSRIAGSHPRGPSWLNRPLGHMERMHRG